MHLFQYHVLIPGLFIHPSGTKGIIYVGDSNYPAEKRDFLSLFGTKTPVFAQEII